LLGVSSTGRSLVSVLHLAALIAGVVALTALITGSDPAWLQAVVLFAIASLAASELIRTIDAKRAMRDRDEIKQELATSEERASRILDLAPDAYIATDADHKIRNWNAAAEDMFGWSRELAIGRDLPELLFTERERGDYQARLGTLAEKSMAGSALSDSHEFTAVRRDGVELAVAASVLLLVDSDGTRNYHAFIRDISDHKEQAQSQAEMLAREKQAARVDVLTGLSNRRAWDEDLEREMARARRSRQPFCVALIDLDYFKGYNDVYGHQAGDHLLTRAARAWQLAVRSSDLVARYGGEEFAVLLPDCTIQEAEVVMDRLRVATPEGQTVSIGVSQWDGSEMLSTLVGRADQALYEAKRSGRDRVVLAA